MARLCFSLLFVIVPSILAQCTVEKVKPSFKRAVYDFSTNLLPRIAQESENHFVTSTFSVWTLLTSASLGATDSTLEELKQVLKLKNNKCFNNKYLQIASNINYDNNTDVLEKTSKVYVDSNLLIQKPFRRNISQGSVFETLSFDDPDRAAQTINDYVSLVTHGTIDELVSAGDVNGVQMVMLDAIHFKGPRKLPFSYEKTQQSAFYNERGVEVGTVNLMFMSNLFKIRGIQNINAKVLELEYSNDDRYSMYLFLPFEGISLYSVMENLKVISLSKINKLFNKMGKVTVRVQIPRFRITSNLRNLKELLIDMGLKSVFDTSAHFSLISYYNLYVSTFIQKADIEVKEEGTVPSVATEAEFDYKSLPDDFTANRPFMFMIVDKKYDIPLCTGAYSKPS